MNPDGHSSKCTWTKCAHPESPEPCPFVKPEQFVPFEEELEREMNRPGPAPCKHEWRQLFVRSQTDPHEHPAEPGGFYCVFCLDKHEK